MGGQPRRLAVQELQKLWKLHAKLLVENRMASPATDKKITKPSDLRIGPLLFVKNHCKGLFDPTYIYDHWVAEILNDITVLLTTPDGKEKKCNIHHIKPVSSLEAYVGLQAEIPKGTFPKFCDSIIQTSSRANTDKPQH